MRVVVSFIFLSFLLLPIGTRASHHELIQSQSDLAVSAHVSQLVIYHAEGIVYENLIEYLVAENSVDFSNSSKTPNQYFKNKNSSFLYLTEFECKSQLQLYNFNVPIIPSLDISTLMYPFHSFF
jgi:hypothetical protein